MAKTVCRQQDIVELSGSVQGSATTAMTQAHNGAVELVSAVQVEWVGAQICRDKVEMKS